MVACTERWCAGRGGVGDGRGAEPGFVGEDSPAPTPNRYGHHGRGPGEAPLRRRGREGFLNDVQEHRGHFLDVQNDDEQRGERVQDRHKGHYSPGHAADAPQAAQQDGSDQQEQDQRRDPCRAGRRSPRARRKWRWSVPHCRGPKQVIAAKMANRPPSHFHFSPSPFLMKYMAPPTKFPAGFLHLLRLYEFQGHGHGEQPPAHSGLRPRGRRAGADPWKRRHGNLPRR